jgi:hypothetical protein
MEFAPLFGRIRGAILFRAEVWEIIRAEGPAVHPAKPWYIGRTACSIPLCLAVFGPTGQEFA